ncbi:S8 family serine peptidase [Blastococcus sp. SYSU DS0533]
MSGPVTRRLPSRLVAATVAAAATAGTVLIATPAGAGDAPVAVADKGSLHHIAATVGAHDAYRAGYTGAGVGIALIDTGVTQVPGLDSGNVVNGPDLSFDSQDPELRYRDAYGHGTHLASIMVGRDRPGNPESYTDPSRFTGIAPDARLVNVKVGAHDGAVDVTQVIAAINWVVEHRNDKGNNIRVINLSYGTDGTQDYAVDPLAYAVENAWRNGIVVVAAGGNDGQETELLANPAMDPHVLAVGSNDTQGTVDVKDDTVPAFASRGTDKRHVDVVAPGVSVLGLRVPNGYADERNPDARVGERLARASGTSQSAAVVSAEVALFLQRHPKATPDDVKAQFMTTASAFPNAGQKYRGSGLAQVSTALTKSLTKGKPVGLSYSTGLGSVEAARGTSHVSRDGVVLQGEADIFGNAWDAAGWALATSQGTVWEGGLWRGFLFSGDDWQGTSWRTAEWTQAAWDARTWRDEEWSARTWRDGSWTARTWREDSWTARTWRDASWSARTWRTADLASAGWS